MDLVVSKKIIYHTVREISMKILVFKREGIINQNPKNYAKILETDFYVIFILI